MEGGEGSGKVQPKTQVCRNFFLTLPLEKFDKLLNAFHENGSDKNDFLIKHEFETIIANVEMLADLVNSKLQKKILPQHDEKLRGLQIKLNTLEDQIRTFVQKRLE